MASLTDQLTTHLASLDLTPLPSSPLDPTTTNPTTSPSPLTRPLDIARLYLSSLLHNYVPTSTPSQAYSSIVWPANVDNGDLAVILPKLYGSNYLKERAKERGGDEKEGNGKKDGWHVVAFGLVEKFQENPCPLFELPFSDGGVHLRFMFHPETLFRLLIPYIETRGRLYGAALPSSVLTAEGDSQSTEIHQTETQAKGEIQPIEPVVETPAEGETQKIEAVVEIQPEPTPETNAIELEPQSEPPTTEIAKEESQPSPPETDTITEPQPEPQTQPSAPETEGEPQSEPLIVEIVEETQPSPETTTEQGTQIQTPTPAPAPEGEPQADSLLTEKAEEPQPSPLETEAETTPAPEPQPQEESQIQPSPTETQPPVPEPTPAPELTPEPQEETQIQPSTTETAGEPQVEPLPTEAETTPAPEPLPTETEITPTPETQAEQQPGPETQQESAIPHTEAELPTPTTAPEPESHPTSVSEPVPEPQPTTTTTTTTPAPAPETLPSPPPPSSSPPTPQNPKRIILEFSSPNLATPFAPRHLRSTLIGLFLSNLYTSFGYTVHKINYLGDWGKNLALLGVGFAKYASISPVTEPGTGEGVEGEGGNLKEGGVGGQEMTQKRLAEVYKKIEEEFKPEQVASKKARDDKTGEEAEIESRGLFKERNEWFAHLEEGREAELTFFKSVREKFVAHYEELYAALGITFDEYTGESQVKPETMVELEGILKEKGILEADIATGSWIVDLKKHGAKKSGMCIIRDRSGSSTYLLRDLAAIVEREGEWEGKGGFDKMVYVVCGDQHVVHFHRVQRLLELLDMHGLAERLVHVNYGEILGLEEEGGDGEGLLESLLVKSKEVVRGALEAHPDRAAVIGSPVDLNVVGANALLMQELTSRKGTDYKFEMGKMTSFDGGPGMDVLYWYKKLCGLLEENEGLAGLSLEGGELEDGEDELKDEDQNNLLRWLVQYPDVTLLAFTSLESAHVVKYLFDVIQQLERCLESEEEEIGETVDDGAGKVEGTEATPEAIEEKTATAAEILTEIETKVEEIQAETNEQEPNVEAMEAKMEEIQTMVEEIDMKADETEAKLEEQEDKVKEIEANVEEVQSEAMEADVDATEAKVEEQEDKVIELEAGVEEVQVQVEVARKLFSKAEIKLYKATKLVLENGMNLLGLRGV